MFHPMVAVYVHCAVEGKEQVGERDASVVTTPMAAVTRECEAEAAYPA